MYFHVLLWSSAGNISSRSPSLISSFSLERASQLTIRSSAEQTHTHRCSYCTYSLVQCVSVIIAAERVT